MRDPAADDHRVWLSTGHDDATVPITWLALEASNVGLGFRLAPSGDQAQEIRFRTMISDAMASKLSKSTLTPSEA